MGQQPRPGVGVAVFIKKRNFVLLLRRKGAHGAGTWAPPGGHMEWGESLEVAADREVLEEVGVKISQPVFLGLTNDIIGDEGKHYVTIFMDARWELGEPCIKEPDRADNLIWHNLADPWPEPLFYPLQNFLHGRVYRGQPALKRGMI